MIWFVVGLVYLGALIWTWQQQKAVSGCSDVHLDFGDSVESVEPVLRLLASHAEREGLCLNVYVSAVDDEAKAIAYRLGAVMPLNLVFDHYPQDEEPGPLNRMDVLLRSHQRKSKEMDL